MNPSYYGATLLLSQTPTPERALEIASQVAEEYFPGSPYEYRITDNLPDSTPVDVSDQYEAYRRDSGDHVYLLVYPVDN